MEFIVSIAAIAAMAWGAWKVRADFIAEEEDELRSAWQTVLHDPDYPRRRQMEETRYLRHSRAR